MVLRIYIPILLIFMLVFERQCFALSFDSDVPAETQKQVLSDLSMISQIKGSQQTDLHRQIFGQLSGASYRNFFDSHIEAFGMDPFANDAGNAFAHLSIDPVTGAASYNIRKKNPFEIPKKEDSSKAKEIAAVIPALGSRKIWLTDNYIRAEVPQIARLMLLFHEARHAEVRSGNWLHSHCPTPFLDENGREIVSIWSGGKLAGQEACDETPFGSYGSSTILMKNIARFCDNCAEKLKMDADLYATDQLQRISTPDAKTRMLQDFSQK